MIGTPPAAAASKKTGTLCRAAASKMACPCSASSALLPVTTILPRSIAPMISSRAGWMPPINSTTTWMASSSIKSCQRVVSSSSGTRRACFADRARRSCGWPGPAPAARKQDAVIREVFVNPGAHIPHSRETDLDLLHFVIFEGGEYRHSRGTVSSRKRHGIRQTGQHG